MILFLVSVYFNFVFRKVRNIRFLELLWVVTNYAVNLDTPTIECDTAQFYFFKLIIVSDSNIKALGTKSARITFNETLTVTIYNF